MNSKLFLILVGIACIVQAVPYEDNVYKVEVVKKTEIETQITEDGETKTYSETRNKQWNGRHRGSRSNSNEHGDRGSGTGSGHGNGSAGAPKSCHVPQILAPLNVLYHIYLDDHYYTPFLEEVYQYWTDPAAAWKLEGASPGSVSLSGTDCTGNPNGYKSVTLLLSPNGAYGIPKDKMDHFYVIDEEEIQNAVKNGYNNGGNIYYCSATQNHCGASLALKRYIKGFDHMYTTSDTQGNQWVAQGAKYEKVLCYIWPSKTSIKAFLEQNPNHVNKGYLGNIAKTWTLP